MKDVEIIIDSRYDYKFDRKSRTVDITDKKGYPAGFWSENIYSLTGIVGNNGAGKSTVMEFLLDNLIEGSPYESKGDIFIYKDDRGLYYIGDNITVMYNDKVIGPQEDSYKNMTVFYYSGHFTPSVMDSPVTSELAGSYIASDNVRIIKDLEGYYNEPSISMTLPLNRYFYSHIARNHYRICSMLADRKLSSLIKEFVWPNSVGIAINKSGYDAMTKSIFDHNRLADQKGWPRVDVVIPEDLVSAKINCPKEHFLTHLIYHNLLNLTYDLWGGWQHGFDIINQWQSYVKDGPVMKQFKMFIKTVENHDKQVHLSSLYELLSNLISLTEYKINIFGEGYLSIDCIKKVDKLLEFGEKVLKNDFYLTSKFCDLYYSSTFDGAPARLSSGEQVLLNLFSRLYEAITIDPLKFTNKSYANLILLDESEIGFHPEWQRSYISLLVEFLDALKITNSTISDFQVLISTHSPILLSDIPNCCTNYLKRERYGTTYKTVVESNTFAANVFNLYRMSFFMKEGLVGKFATKKVNDILERIDNEDMHGVLESIQMIGDERIRGLLMNKYEQVVSPEELIKCYEKRIEQLKKGLKDE